MDKAKVLIHSRIDLNTVSFMTAYAEENGYSMSALVNLFCKWGVERIKSKDKPTQEARALKQDVNTLANMVRRLEDMRPDSLDSFSRPNHIGADTDIDEDFEFTGKF